jgi:drug/metabolite transporter (DMT)-like permease
VKPSGVAAYLWMLLGCLAFTGMNTLVHALRDTCDWQVIALCRTGLAFVFAVLLAAAGGARLVFVRPRSLWIRSLAGSVSLVCCFFALTREGPVSNVLAITNIFPLWIALLSWPMLGLKPGWSVLLSVVTAVSGVLLIRAPQIAAGHSLLDLSDDTALAALFAFVASFATAVAMLGLNRLYWLDTRAVVAHFSGISMLVCFGALLGFDHPTPVASLGTEFALVMLLGVGVTATAGQLCLTKAFTIGQPAKVAVVGLTQIVFTLLVDVWVFGVEFTPLNLLGIVLVLAPTAWVLLQSRRGRRQDEDFRNSSAEKLVSGWDRHRAGREKIQAAEAPLPPR